jgi:glycosyltransferase involved in cell wall biosynthesis
MKQPLVSVGIPCYNQQQYIAEALESVLTQNYGNLRIVVSDDASQDATSNIVRDFAARHPDKIVAQFHRTNLGVTENARSMAALIEGDYVCWLAGDDIFLPGKIVKQVFAMEANPAAVMCYHDMEVFEDRTKKTLYRYNEPGPGQRPFQGDIVRHLLTRRCFVGANSIMLRRAAVNDIEIRAGLQRVSDWVYITEIAHRGEVIYLDEVLTRYRRHPNNLSKVVDIGDERAAYSLFEVMFPQYAGEIERGRSRLELSFLVQYVLLGRLREGAALAASLARRVWSDAQMRRFLARSFGEMVVQRLHLALRTRKIWR